MTSALVRIGLLTALIVGLVVAVYVLHVQLSSAELKAAVLQSANDKCASDVDAAQRSVSDFKQKVSDAEKAKAETQQAASLAIRQSLEAQTKLITIKSMPAHQTCEDAVRWGNGQGGQL